MSKERVLIVEQNSTGHRLFYARLLVDAAVERGAAVSLLLDRDGDRTAEAIHLASLPDRVRVLRDRILAVEDIESLSRDEAATRTVVPDGDRFALRLAQRRSWNGAGRLTVLIMRERAQPRRVGASSRMVAAIRSSLRTIAFKRVAAMRAVDLRVLKSAGWAGKASFVPAIDPVKYAADPQSIARFRALHDLGDDRYWFAVLGAISARKNLDLVLQAIDGVKAPWGLLVAGSIEEDVADAVKERLGALVQDGKAVVIDRLLTDEELDAAVAAVDCVVLAHSNEGPSGLLGKAAAAGTRVVGAGAQSLRHDLGALPGLGDWADLSRVSLTRLLDQASLLPRPQGLLDVGSSRFTDALL